MPLIYSGIAVFTASAPAYAVTKYWEHGQKAKWNDEHIEHFNAKTTPEIIAACIVFHKNCTPEDRDNYRKSIHELYETPENRPVMDIAARGIKESTPRLIIEVGIDKDKKSLSVEEDTAGFFRGNRGNGGGNVAISMQTNDVRQNKGTLIHELAHYATYKIYHNYSKVFSTEAEKQEYKAILDKSEALEVKALSMDEIAAVRTMNEPYLHPIYDNTNSWQKERHVRIPQLIAEIGRAPIEKLYPDELRHFTETFNPACEQYLERKGYISEPVTEHLTVQRENAEASQAISQRANPGDLIYAANFADSVILRAKYQSWGTIRQHAKTFEEQNPEPSCFDFFSSKPENQLTAEQKLRQDLFKEINKKPRYSGSPDRITTRVFLDKACDNMAESLSRAYVKENGEFMFTPAILTTDGTSLKDIVEKSFTDAAVSTKIPSVQEVQAEVASQSISDSERRTGICVKIHAEISSAAEIKPQAQETTERLNNLNVRISRSNQSSVVAHSAMVR